MQQASMDTSILVDDVNRASFLQLVMRTFGCSYVCIWSYTQNYNCLLFWDGRYNEANNPAQVLFREYSQQMFPLMSNCVPGLAFTNQQYIELNEGDFNRLASNETQRRFYREAGIKIVVFLACKSGEIELGLAHPTPINMEMQLKNLFSVQELSLPLPTSSSSSLRSLSLSMDSPDSTSLLFNVQESGAGPSSIPILPHISNSPLPSPETEEAVITRAILAVLTAAAASSSTTTPSQPYPLPPPARPRASAFKKYNLLASSSTSQSLRAQSMLKRAISYYRSLNIARREHSLAGRPSSNQLHHMMSERKRREKINESFQALRALLPPGTKKDKASLLITTREYLTTLKEQVAELTERNKRLEANLLPSSSSAEASGGLTANQRLNITIRPVPESTSEDRIIDLGVSVTTEAPMLDIITRILNFLNQPLNAHVTLISMEANTRLLHSDSFNRFNFRLRIIQGSEWDESVFREAVRRVIADLAQ